MPGASSIDRLPTFPGVQGTSLLARIRGDKCRDESQMSGRGYRWFEPHRRAAGPPHPLRPPPLRPPPLRPPSPTAAAPAAAAPAAAAPAAAGTSRDDPPASRRKGRRMSRQGSVYRRGAPLPVLLLGIAALVVALAAFRSGSPGTPQ